MSIAKLRPEDFEYFTVETNPKRIFSSSSIDAGGNGTITGSVYLFARRSDSEKEIYPLSMFSRSYYHDQNLDEFRNNILRQTGLNRTSSVETYLSAVNEQQVSVRKQQTVSIIRFEPPFSLNSNMLRKSAVINMLMPFYRTIYPQGSHFNYVNYHCLNFFTASNVPSGSVILYPNPVRSGTMTEYGFTGSFAFDFWIKPKYTTDERDSLAVYKPGCLFHLTNSYVVSIHSGSSRDVNGRPDKFKLFLQLSNSADISPSQLTNSGSLIFMSEDNILPINEWSHCTIRWGGTGYNFGSGSFMVNGQTKGIFVITSTLGGIGDQNYGDPSVLCVGNYYEGQNTGTRALSRFFAADTTTREGLYELDGTTDIFAPAEFTFNHPLNSEVHELKIFESDLNNDQILDLSASGPKAPFSDRLRFYLPPFFTEESPTRTFYNSEGGILTTPFFSRDGSTRHPFSIDMAFSCGGHYINLENYVRDFATGRYPRLWELSASVINGASQTPLAANTLLYSTGSIRKRLYSILPNDNGRFIPNFDLLRPMSGSTFKNDIGCFEPGVISLRNMLTASKAMPSLVMSQETGSIVSGLVGADPENPGIQPANSLAIFHRTRDDSSNQIVFFDISNLFYGNQIKPGTFKISDTNISASNGKLGITIKDDELGNLYRADVSGSHATWASVGSIFYNEGIVLLKMPQLYFFGLNEFNIEFKGVQNIHTLTINAYARPMQLVSSSNPSYRSGTLDIENPLANLPVENEKYVYITTVHILDNNLNVVCRTNMAQVLKKSASEKYLFKIKLDY